MQSKKIFLNFFFFFFNCTILSFGKPGEYLEDSREAGKEYDATYISLMHNINNTLFLLKTITVFRKTTPCRVGFFTNVKKSLRQR